MDFSKYHPLHSFLQTVLLRCSHFIRFDFYYKNTHVILLIITGMSYFLIYRKCCLHQICWNICFHDHYYFIRCFMVLLDIISQENFSFTKFETERSHFFLQYFIVVHLSFILFQQNVYLDIIIKLLLIFCAVLSLKLLNFRADRN